MKWSKNAITVLEARYLLRDKQGKVIETPDQMLERVARCLSGGEKEQSKWFDAFMSILDTLEFLPNSPTLMNAGTDHQQLSACFLLPIEDSITNIFEMVKQVALIHQSGGGTGIVLSRLRPQGSLVRSSWGVASGPVSFMRVFDTATDVIKQGGKRRGANMGILSINHPNIVDFIKCKEDRSRFQNFNISVSVTDNFMKAVKAGNGYPLRDPYTKEKKQIEAGKLFEMLCHQSWLTGEPGVFFVDTVNARNPTPHLGRIEGSNPCGEVPLLPYESCNLGSIDVSKFAAKGKFDWDRLSEVVAIAVRFLDDVIDVNQYPNVKISRKTHMTRKIGLGVMGWADLLISMNIRYDSEKALALARRLMMNIRETAHIVSRELGKEKGCCFDGLRRRNATLTTIAPTGTLSILADCSSSIEPLFDKSYTKTVLDGKKLELGAKIKPVDESVLVTAHEMAPAKHIEMQAAFQQYTDNAVSKTINLPATATEQDVQQIFVLAHELLCKGVTVYREGSRNAPLESTELSECDSDKCQI